MLYNASSGQSTVADRKNRPPNLQLDSVLAVPAVVKTCSFSSRQIPRSLQPRIYFFELNYNGLLDVPSKAFRFGFTKVFSLSHQNIDFSRLRSGFLQYSLHHINLRIVPQQRTLSSISQDFIAFRLSSWLQKEEFSSSFPRGSDESTARPMLFDNILPSPSLEGIWLSSATSFAPFVRITTRTSAICFELSFSLRVVVAFRNKYEIPPQFTFS
jgi:hypothetical protein